MPAATFTQIRDALKTAVTAMPDITEIYKHPPEQVSPPCAVVDADDPYWISSDESASGLDEWRLRVLFIAGRVDVDEADALLDKLTDPPLIKHTIEAAPAWTNLLDVSEVSVTKAGSRGVLRVAELDYLASRVFVTVLGDSGVHTP